MYPIKMYVYVCQKKYTRMFKAEILIIAIFHQIIVDK